MNSTEIYDIVITASSKEIYFTIQCGCCRFPIQDLPKVFDKRKKSHLLSRYFKELANIVTLLYHFMTYTTLNRILSNTLYSSVYFVSFEKKN